MTEREIQPSDAGRLDALLQPTLGDRVKATSIYSVRASFMVAFFGGPFAAVIFGGLNSRRLGRLGKDAWLLILGLLGFCAYTAAIGYGLDAFGFEASSSSTELTREQSRTFRMIARVLGLAFFGGIFLLHRPFHKAAELVREDSPSPWGPGIAASLVGGLISVAMFGLGAALRQ